MKSFTKELDYIVVCTSAICETAEQQLLETFYIFQPMTPVFKRSAPPMKTSESNQTFFLHCSPAFTAHLLPTFDYPYCNKKGYMHSTVRCIHEWDLWLILSESQTDPHCPQFGNLKYYFNFHVCLSIHYRNSVIPPANQIRPHAPLKKLDSTHAVGTF